MFGRFIFCEYQFISEVNLNQIYATININIFLILDIIAPFYHIRLNYFKKIKFCYNSIKHSLLKKVDNDKNIWNKNLRKRKKSFKIF